MNSIISKRHPITCVFKRMLIPCLAFTVVATSHAINIQATYDPNITDPGALSTLKSVVQFFDNHYTGSSVVRIDFKNTSSGLGGSSTRYDNVTYATYLAALNAHSSGDTVDTTALGVLNTPGNAPAFAQRFGVNVPTALLRDLGIENFTGAYDSTISLNLGLTFNGHAHPNSGYDLWAVAAHEIDEVLGTSSGLNDVFVQRNVANFNPADLFRYVGLHTRSFTYYTGSHAYLSIDGVNILAEYNQYGKYLNGSDWGDFADPVSPNPPLVQDAYGAPGVVVNYGTPETTLLDAVGWNVNTQAVPEPAPIAAIGIGALLLGRRKKKA